INAMTVSNYLKYFETNGIVIQNWFKNQKHSIKIVGLQQLGIPVPKMKKRLKVVVKRKKKLANFNLKRLFS
ncbi:MAG: hypothetical protein HY929_00445, partial [Euryarchaeota archaeon]|nr:hypothetical protein [Euryarchaeota archaeon]